MQEMYKRVPEMLKKRGQANRADAIIGLSVDIDAISGKGASYLLLLQWVHKYIISTHFSDSWNWTFPIYVTN
jgi:hypothetical protein